MASDNENITTTEIPPQEPVAQEKTAAPPARDMAADKTDEAARPQRHPREHRPHREKGEHAKTESAKADPIAPAAVAPIADAPEAAAP